MSHVQREGGSVERNQTHKLHVGRRVADRAHCNFGGQVRRKTVGSGRDRRK